MAAPYDLLGTATNLARVRFNDAIANGLAGQTITDANPITLVMCNAAWRRLQDQLAGYGSSELKEEFVFFTLPAGSSTDPAVQESIDWTTTPPLPADLISPLKMWERVSALGGNFYEMDQFLNGLPSTGKTNLNKVWEWRREKIVIPGATVQTDVRLRYIQYLADFVLFSDSIPIVHALNPMAWLICSEASKARGDSDASYFDQMADQGIRYIWGRDSTQAASINRPAEYGKMAVPAQPPPQNGAMQPTPVASGGPK